MKRITTMITCAMLLAYGAIVGLNNKADPGVTATAAPVYPVMSGLPYDLQLSHTKHDTIYVDKYQVCNHKERVKEVKVPYAIHDTLYVPVLYIATPRVREEEACSSAQSKYVVRKACPEDINYETIFIPEGDN